MNTQHTWLFMHAIRGQAAAPGAEAVELPLRLEPPLALLHGAEEEVVVLGGRRMLDALPGPGSPGHPPLTGSTNGRGMGSEKALETDEGIGRHHHAGPAAIGLTQTG